MEAKNLIDDLKTKGIHLYRHGDKLKWRAQKGMLTKADKTLLKKRKQELLQHLEGPRPYPFPVDQGNQAVSCGLPIDSGKNARKRR